MHTPFLGLDVGNTRLTAAVVSRDGGIVAQESVPAPGNACEAIEALVVMARDLISAHEVAGVGIGFGGPVDVQHGRIRTSFLSGGWDDVALGEHLARRLGRPAFLLNDADAGGLAEALFGAGAGLESVLYVNVGTGIGGAVVLDGRVRTGATGCAGEIGHFTVVPDGPACECGKRGCAQALSSGTAIARRARELTAERRADGRLPDTALADMPEARITGRLVGHAAKEGDALARAVIEEAGEMLGIAVANAALLLDPAIIVVGGGVAELGDLFLLPLRSRYQRAVLPPLRQTPIRPAQLGYQAGVIGAAAAAMTEQGAKSEP